MGKSVKGMFRASEWNNPEEKMSSEYGFITFSEWVEKEKARLIKGGISAEIAHNAKGELSLWRKK